MSEPLAAPTGATLKPCPFCGDAMKRISQASAVEHSSRRAEVECVIGGRKYAITAWNRRVDAGVRP